MTRWFSGAGVEICVNHPILREGRDTRVSHLGEEQHVSGPEMDSIVPRDGRSLAYARLGYGLYLCGLDEPL